MPNNRLCNPSPYTDPPADFLWGFHLCWIIYITALCICTSLTPKWYRDKPLALYSALRLSQTLFSGFMESISCHCLSYLWAHKLKVTLRSKHSCHTQFVILYHGCSSDTSLKRAIAWLGNGRLKHPCVETPWHCWAVHTVLQNEC